MTIQTINSIKELHGHGYDCKDISIITAIPLKDVEAILSETLEW